jgi:hypothetical protein
MFQKDIYICFPGAFVSLTCIMHVVRKLLHCTGSKYRMLNVIKCTFVQNSPFWENQSYEPFSNKGSDMIVQKLQPWISLKYLSVLGLTTLTWSQITYFIYCTVLSRSRGTSVSIVSDYGLDDWGLIPDRGRGFFF